jgi:hypothetical protein
MAAKRREYSQHNEIEVPVKEYGDVGEVEPEEVVAMAESKGK